MLERLVRYAETLLARVVFATGRMRLSSEEKVNIRTPIVLVVIAVFLFVFYTWIVMPPKAFPVEELVTISEGMTLNDASASLKESGVVRSEIALRLIITALRRDTNIRAGDYLFKEPRNIFEIAGAITTGAFGLEPERIRIHEGATVREMAKIFATRLKRVDEARFVELALPSEGLLFPDTYFFLPNAREEMIIQAMRQNFDSHIADVDDELKASGRTLQDIITMASLLEREARNMTDRRMIAGVLWNRIDRDMLLQVDAAFLYTLGKATFDLTIEDLESDSPYNTYQNKGLPPTPIGNPSIESIRAAATPIEHAFLYYLADNHGTTYYSKTYEEHLRKKRLYLGT